ncbi:polysaccharide biosynthesis protein [Streptomyces zinciresistens K42]|uniref:Polysaccharide biosynthesis protein n=1 Tax=Streptomyces zinciresistens K42 TaxID=700597 RepID=G2GFD2_9ACTN|nr:Wzz/FepE/Etk N-terminal domain-containing protein [Streptomyces zinciresistens]EGX57794.1 polysaccharide biosynthesis protein [Streptomyces zinciresistens K42]
MNDDTIRLAAIGRILRRRWRLLAVLTVLGALAGQGVSMLLPPRYTASASVLLPGQWEERELLTQVDIATSSAVVDRAAEQLAWQGVDGAGLRDDVRATAADGNIITISGTADTPRRAQRLSDQVAQEFVTFATRIAGGATDPEAATGTEALRRQVARTNRRISDLARAADPGSTVESVQARTELERLRTSLQEAMKKLADANPANNRANLVVMGPAPRPAGTEAPTRIQLVAAGALLFFLAALLGHLAAARVNRRPRGEAELTAALGTVLLGVVDVPQEAPARQATGRGPRARLARLLGTDTRWDLPVPHRSGGEADRRIRHRRVCARLREQLPSPGGLLVIVPDGDEIALRAAGQLVAEAAGDPVLRVVEVSAQRPTVPDRGLASGALVVLSAGTCTADQLDGLAGACADGGHEIAGLVVAEPVRDRQARTTGRTPREAAPALAARGHATGGSA